MFHNTRYVLAIFVGDCICYLFQSGVQLSIKNRTKCYSIRNSRYIPIVTRAPKLAFVRNTLCLFSFFQTLSMDRTMKKIMSHKHLLTSMVVRCI